jgi:hypothetical protein
LSAIELPQSRPALLRRISNRWLNIAVENGLSALRRQQAVVHFRTNLFTREQASGIRFVLPGRTVGDTSRHDLPFPSCGIQSIGLFNLRIVLTDQFENPKNRCVPPVSERSSLVFDHLLHSPGCVTLRAYGPHPHSS